MKDTQKIGSHFSHKTNQKKYQKNKPRVKKHIIHEKKKQKGKKYNEKKNINKQRKKNKEFNQNVVAKKQDLQSLKKTQYRLKILGFTVDISLQQIYILLEGKKVKQIVTKFIFQQQFQQNKAQYMQTIIIFNEKEEVIQFVEKYGNKVLDNQHKLIFTFI